jgi:type I restriction enzyme S subunit
MTDVNKLITDNIDVWTSAIKKRNKQGRGSSKKIELTGVKKLRELILELAVRGKLVPQDPNDEPASVLLERIAEEKAQLIKEGKIKKQKPLPVMIDEVKAFNLPHGWEWSKLQNIGHDLGQKTPDQDFTYIDVASINKELGFIEEPNILIADNAPSRARKLVKKGTVIYSTVRPYLLNIAVINDEFSPEPIASTAFSIIHPLKGVLASYVYRYLRSPIFISYVESVQTGIAYPAINDKQFFSGLIAVPPEAEQHRIVAKVDELMTLCDQLEQQTEESLAAQQTLVTVLLAALTDSASAEEFQTSWQRIAEHFDVLFTTEHSIEQLKQTILQLAVMGKLVPQNPSDEPASVLLEKIAEEKAQLIADKKIKKQKPLPLITDEEKPFELPSSWEWCNLGTLTTIRGGKRLPKGQQLTTDKTPYIYIRVSDMRNGSIREDDLHYISEDVQSKISNYIITKDDIYMTIVGATIGKCGLVPPKFSGMNLTENAARLTPFWGIDKTYLFKCLDSSFAQEQFFDKTKQVGVQKMALNRLSSTKIPFPPLAEQQRIVAKVNELMALCEKLKARVSNAQTTQLHLADAVVENALSAPASS